MDERWIFSPKESPRHREVDESKLVVYNAESEVFQLQTPNPQTKNPEIDAGTVVVYIHGCSRQTVGAKLNSAWSVYLGPDSMYNSQGTTNIGDTMAAEIDALWQAVYTIGKINRNKPNLCNFVIATDSDYIPLAMSFWGPNGGRSAAGKPVPFANKFMPIYNDLYFTNFAYCAIERVKFWRVRPDQNEDACKRALQVLGM